MRNDAGVYPGATVTVHYDPLISKLITWGRDRPEAIARMRRALREFVVKGIKTSIPFHQKVFRHPRFLEGHYDTGFIEDHILSQPQLLHAPSEEERQVGIMLAAIAAYKRDRELARRAAQSAQGSEATSKWKLDGRRRQLRGGG